MPTVVTNILICAGGACISSGEKSVKSAIEEELKKYSLEGSVRIIETGCMGTCSLGPIVAIYPDGVFYQKVTPESARRIVEEHVLKGRIVKDLLFEGEIPEIPEKFLETEPFFAKQVKIVTRNLGIIDPMSIDEYIARDGYFALAKALEMKPEEVIDEIEKSGLRGRGGAGFPTGLKWKLARQQKSEIKYVVCNADEGDPGAFMDRSILEGDPHSVIEGMVISAYAIGAKKGYVYIRAEYPLAIERLENALKQAKEYGFLGEAILGRDFNFDIEIRIGAGAFVCGEETALMASIEGKRGQPRV
ncbi:MAG: NADH-quinone oxidoreductase subunit F, partial [Thermotoga sp.]